MGQSKAAFWANRETECRVGAGWCRVGAGRRQGWLGWRYEKRAPEALRTVYEVE